MNDEILKNKKIVNWYDQPNGNMLIRLDDRTEIVIFKGIIRDDDDEVVSINGEIPDGWSE